jgi:glutamate 5-kinase
LLLLTDVDGLLTAPPGTPGAERVPLYDARAEVLFGGASQGGTGGMEAKVEAARVATQAGVPVVITSGRLPGVVRRVVEGEDLGTLFPGAGRGDARRRWLQFATAPSGALHINAGARVALLDRKASLLPVGLERVEGEWEAGEVVRVIAGGVELGRGVCALSSGDARRVRGRQGERALVHRNDLVLLEQE